MADIGLKGNGTLSLHIMFSLTGFSVWKSGYDLCMGVDNCS